MRNHSVGSSNAFAPLLAALAVIGGLTGCFGSSDGPAARPSVVAVLVSPVSATVVQGGTQQFSGQLTGAGDASLVWSVQGTPGGSGTITASGLYTAPNLPGSYTIIATSRADAAVSASARVTVPEVGLTVSPTVVSLAGGATATFSAAVSGARETGVRWTVLSGGAGGKVSAGGVYTAPQVGGADTVIATSITDPLQSASAQVTVAVPVSLTVSPALSTLPQGATLQFAAQVAGTANAAVIWSVQGPVASSVSAAGLFTAPISPGIFTIRAQSVAEPASSATATVVVPAIAVSVTPAAVSLAAGGTINFTASVAGAANTAVAWSVSPGGAGGTIDSGGVYTAPAGSGADTVIATSIVNRSQTGQALVAVRLPVTVAVAPSAATVLQGGTQQFTAQVGGSANTAVGWSVQLPTGGSITAGGLYTAPNAAGLYTVTATSQADTTRSGNATVTVPPVSVSASPSSLTVTGGASTTLTAVVAGTVNTSVIWSVQPGGAGGTVTPAGLYTAPSVPGTDIVVATSAADGSKTSQVVVTVIVPIAVTVSPALPTVNQGATRQFTATVVGTGNSSVSWSVQSGGGTISPAGLYTAPAGATAPGSYTVTATSQADATRSGSTQVTVPPVAVLVSPASVKVLSNNTAPFTAQVSGAADGSVVWTVQPGGAGGTISASGIYTAPALPGTDTVVATSNADPGKKGTAVVSIAAVLIDVSPAAALVNQGAAQQFSAQVQGLANTAVTWSLQPPSGSGSITSGGLYLAPLKAGTFTVVATSVADPTRTGTAQVTVPAIAVQVSPTTATVQTRGTQSFTAAVTGAANSAVTWSVTAGGAGGSVSSAGLYTAPASGSGTDTVVATSAADGATAGQAVVTVPPVAVIVSPASQTLRQGATQQFTAQVTGSSNTAVNWSVQGTGSGSITAQGLYTAPAGPGAAGTFTVVAQSQADLTKAGSTAVTVSPIAVSVAPSTVTLSGGQAQTFSATVTGAVNTAVTWSALIGAIDPTSGTYTAPATGTSDTVTAASVVDGSKTGTATVTLAAQSATAVVPQVAKSLVLGNFKGTSVATDGSSYVTGLLTGTATFDAFTLTSAGMGDVFLARYDASGNTLWARNYGDANDQEPTGVAVTSSVVAAIGQFLGSVGPVSNGGTAAIDYLLAIDPTTGNILWGKAFNLGLGGSLLAVGANPRLGLIAVCGQAVQAATDLVPGASYGGLNDLVIGVFDSTGALKWSKQIGTANNELCSAITVDALGNVVAAGKYDGSGTVLGFTGTQLPAPGSSFRKHLWVASFNGATGAAANQISFGSGAGSHTAAALAADGSGNVVLAGSFTNSVPFGAFTAGTACTATQPGCLVSAGGTDGFVARLGSTLLPAFATRIGGTGTDAANGVAVDSLGNPVAVGVINGATTVSSVTPATVAPAAAPALTTPSASPAAFLVKLPGASGAYNPATANVYGNATNAVGASAVSINNQGSGAAKDLVVFGGTYAGALSFGGSSTAISTASPSLIDFLVFGKLQ